MASATSRVLLLLLVLLVEIAVLLDASLGESSASSSSDEYISDGVVVRESVIFTSSAVASASFIKTFIVEPPESEVDVAEVEHLHVGIPGRVFINYVDYESAGGLVNSSTLAAINVYSESSTLVDHVFVSDGGWSPKTGTALNIFFGVKVDISTTGGSLLVEVAVFRSNQLRNIGISPKDFSVVIVVEDGVARSRTDSPEFTTDSDGYLELRVAAARMRPTTQKTRSRSAY